MYNKDGTLLICVTAIDTQSKIEKSSSVNVADSEGRYWLIALKFPKPNPYLEKPLLEMYKQYMKGSVHNYHLHKYPIAARVHLNSFARQYLIRKRNIENQVKMRCLKMLVSKSIATLMLTPWWLCIILSLVMTSATYCFQWCMVLMIPKEKVSLMLKRNLNLYKSIR